MPSLTGTLRSIWTYRILRVGLGGLFVVSGVLKLASMSAFEEAMGAYGLDPEWGLAAAAVGLSVFELAAGLGLIVDVRGTLACVTGLLLVFIGVLLYGIYLGLDVDCGCLGPADPESYMGAGLGAVVLRDFGLLIICAYLYWWRREEKRS